MIFGKRCRVSHCRSQEKPWRFFYHKVGVFRCNWDKIVVLTIKRCIIFKINLLKRQTIIFCFIFLSDFVHPTLRDKFYNDEISHFAEFTLNVVKCLFGMTINGL